MAIAHAFTKEDMAVDQSVGYPRAYAKLCNDSSLSPYIHGPPLTFTPYILQPQEASRTRELDEMFPIIDPQAKPTAKPRIFVSLLWKQLNHLGNAGFDPAMFRVDPYGNVLYYHADSASPLAWDIDHWFPCSRGGLTVPRNLRILQWQACKRKRNQLEFLVPWWDLQLGISINQFLSIFAASNSDFRHRAFRLLFSGGENEELNDLQTVDAHNFPQPFMESKDQLGLAPAAIVQTRRESCDASFSTLRSLDFNRQSRPSTPTIATSRKLKNGGLKENEMSDMATNPYQAIVMARDSLKQREETKQMKAEIQRLDDEVIERRLKNEEEKLTIQELELALIKRRRRAEKCRRLAETQSSYRAMLEKMIRNTMHQCVLYKEQLRQNQAATSALMARLEAQMALCNSAEKELQQRFKLRDELEKQIIPQWEHARKRSRTDDDALREEKEDRTLIYLPRIDTSTPLHKQLRVFLEEEHRLSEEALSLIEERKGEEEVEIRLEEPLGLTFGHEIIDEHGEPINVNEGTSYEDPNFKFPFARETEVEEDEESRKERGKGNVEKWLQLLLESTGGEVDSSSPQPAQEPETNKTDEIIKMLDEKYPLKEVNGPKLADSAKRTHVQDQGKQIRRNAETEDRKPRSMSTPRRSVSSETDIICKRSETRKSFGWDKSGKEKGLARTESARSFRPILPSSPSMILNMRKGVDCMRKKPMVIDDEDDYGDENQPVGNNFLKSSIKSGKKAVKM